MGRPSYDEETLAAYFQPVHSATYAVPIVGEVLARLAVEDPDVIEAVADVDRSQIRASLRRGPLERLRVAGARMRTLGRFRRVG
jgi:hypothetical protein